MSLENKKNRKKRDIKELAKQIVYIDKKLVQKVKTAAATKEEEEELLLKL
ncbi:hypothetical protein [Halarcobacter anaerophilus]|nr:hypothetical protein [Halarcobacter anaerophilus]